jgi:hypothetical protein
VCPPDRLRGSLESSVRARGARFISGAGRERLVLLVGVGEEDLAGEQVTGGACGRSLRSWSCSLAPL